jgi:hypothetical protein
MNSGHRFETPDIDELEVSIFGPGRGECVVIHVPSGPWLIVDSFAVRSPTGDVPVAVEYLRRLKVSDVAGFFITHWHDDHTRGAADIIRAFPASLKRVGLPSAIGERELASFVADLLPDKQRFKIVQELVAVISALNELSGIHSVVLGDGVSFQPSPGCSLEVMSPSLDDLRHQAVTMASYLPGWTGPPPRRYDVNSGCAVMRLTCGPFGVMLYSDLDVGDDDKRGLRCIVKKYGAGLRADIVKIGHHGSETAYYPPALAAGNADQAVGAITPFPARGEALPRRKHVAQYKAALRAVHLTAGLGPQTQKVGKVPLRDTPFSEYVKTSPRHLDAIGQVRYRIRNSENTVRVELFPSAIAA